MSIMGLASPPNALDDLSHSSATLPSALSLSDHRSTKIIQERLVREIVTHHYFVTTCNSVTHCYSFSWRRAAPFDNIASPKPLPNTMQPTPKRLQLQRFCVELPRWMIDHVDSELGIPGNAAGKFDTRSSFIYDLIMSRGAYPPPPPKL
jgi:hypothetical protein